MMLVELADLFGTLWNEAEEYAHRRQAMAVMAAVRGDLVANEGCEVRWNNRADYEAGMVQA